MVAHAKLAPVWMRVALAIPLAGALFVVDAGARPEPADAALGCIYTDLKSSSVNNITCGRLAHGHRARPVPTAPVVRSGNWVGPLNTSKSPQCYAYASVVKG